MGDVLTLIERAEAAADEDEQADLEKRLRQGQFSFDDFLASYRMLRKMGPLQGLLKMIPGLGKQLGDVEIDDKQMGRVEAIVLSMTPKERRAPKMIDGSRRKRIAAGSGTSVEQVNQLLEARKQMEKMMGQLGKGKMPSFPGMEGLPGAPGASSPNGGGGSATRRSKSKRKKSKAKRKARK
jgi:signal recognition particle subunit SRP54